jgi:predicted phage terminase large subunit-like protein
MRGCPQNGLSVKGRRGFLKTSGKYRPILPELRDVFFDEYDLVRSICRKDFYSFVVEFWDEIVPDPYIPNWHIKYICDQVQQEVELILARKPKRYDYIIINVPPGSSKSTIMMRMLNGWIWSRDPSRSFIGASYDKNLAVDLAADARKLIKSEKYRRCFPEVEIAYDNDSKGTFGTTKGGKRYSTGTTGNITGKHGDVIVVDDPLNPKAALSELLTKSVNNFMTHTLPSRKRQKAISPTFLIMQRLSEDDPTGMLLDMAKANPKLRIKHVCLPATESDLISPESARKHYRDGLLDPARLSMEALEQAKAEAASEFVYAGQYDQSPIPAGGAMFDVSKLMVEMPPDPNDPKQWVKQVRYTDKAGTYEAGCWTVGFRMGKTPDQRYWILHVDRYQKESCAREARMKVVAGIDGTHVVQALEVEPGSAGKGDAQASARNLAGYRVVLDRPTGDKKTRAEPFATQVNAGNVYLAPENCIPGLEGSWHSTLRNELQFFPFSKFKDQADAGSGAFNQLTSGVFRFGFLQRKKNQGPRQFRSGKEIR